MHMEGSQRLQAHDASLRSRNSSLVQRCFHPSFVCTRATQKHCTSRFLSMCFPRLCLPLQLRSFTTCHGSRCNPCACISPRFQNCKWNRTTNHNDLACPRVCLLPVAPHRLLSARLPLREGAAGRVYLRGRVGFDRVGKRDIKRRHSTRCCAAERLVCLPSRKRAWIWIFLASVERSAGCIRASVPRRTLWAGIGRSTSCRTFEVVLLRRNTWTRNLSL